MPRIYRTILDTLKYWIPIAVVASALAGLVYVAMQQNVRFSANDPQIQMAEDTAAALADGREPQSLLAADKVDIARSLSPYLIVFDDSGRSVTSTAQLDGQIPLPPTGVFAYTKEHGENRFSWQPKSGVRSAAVLTYFSGARSGYVLAGRSLREVEKRENQLLGITAAAWAAMLVVTFAVTAFLVTITSINSQSARPDITSN